MKKQHHLYDQNTAQLKAKISALETILLEKEAVISEKDSAIQKTHPGCRASCLSQ